MFVSLHRQISWAVCLSACILLDDCFSYIRVITYSLANKVFIRKTCRFQTQCLTIKIWRTWTSQWNVVCNQVMPNRVNLVFTNIRCRMLTGDCRAYSRKPSTCYTYSSHKHSLCSLPALIGERDREREREIERFLFAGSRHPEGTCPSNLVPIV